MTIFTQADMHHFAAEAWGAFGTAIVRKWVEFNARYFAGALRPVPLVLTNTQPYGKRLAFCSYSRFGRTITLNVPKNHKTLLADNGSLLHEMIHQLLFEANEEPSHASEAWRREIMRLQAEITGTPIWAGRSITVRQNSKVVRINAPSANGEPSLTQGQIARWPSDTGINLGKLGN
jgi:hypothetical protein